jgi:SAM-dependent methyltransferase
VLPGPGSHRADGIGVGADLSAIRRAFDGVAARYDRDLERDGWIRRLLWKRFDSLFRARDRVIDAGCGTGIDTLHLAERGVRVTSIDASPGMLAELRAKAEGRFGEEAPITLLGDLNAVLSALAGPFDGLISSFAALNTVTLDVFAASAARLIRPGGHLVCHMLAAGYHRRRLSLLLSTATGRNAPASVEVHLGPEAIEYTNLDPDQVYKHFFAPSFRRVACHTVGLIVSPFLEKRLPESALDVLGAVESRLGAAPLVRRLGRFFVLDLVRRTR